MVDELWFAKPQAFHTAPNRLSGQNDRDNCILEKDYEDPECYYSKPPDFPKNQIPLPLPPMKSIQRMIPTRFVIEHKQRSGCNSKVMSMSCLLVGITTLLVLSLAYFLFWNSENANFRNKSQSVIPQEKDSTGLVPSSSNSNVIKSKVEIDVVATSLLTLLITKRKLCLFEAGTDRSEESKREYREEHIESARLLQFTNLSVNGAPIHPLQFQRYTRSLGVDPDCYVIIYDRGEVVWATHAFWIFTLFGHQKVSLYSGGINEWKKLKKNSAQYRTESGDGMYPQRSGHFRTQWNTAVICTFDDVLTNMELRTHDLVDGQDREQYEGTSSEAIYGHIRSAINIPTNDVYDWHSQKWHDESELKGQFRSRRLHMNRPVIVYSSSAIRSSLIWFALRKCGYNSSIYYGSWPEWLILAPEFLKIVPKRRF